MSEPIVFQVPKELFQHCIARGIFIFADDDSKVIPTEVQKDHSSMGRIHCLQTATAWPDDGYHIGGPSGIWKENSNLWITEDLHTTLNAQLPDDRSSIRRLSTWTINRSFAYIDVSEFSRQKPGWQALIINSIAALVRNAANWNAGYAHHVSDQVESAICIGDGYIYVFKDAVDAAFFSAYLARLFEEALARKRLPVPFHFRMGVHNGPVYCFWDEGRKDWNFIGEGINGDNRVITAIGPDLDDVLFVSDSIRQEIMANNDGRHPYANILSCLHNRGRKADKHGKMWRVYELNYSDLIPIQEMPDSFEV